MLTHTHTQTKTQAQKDLPSGYTGRVCPSGSDGPGQATKSLLIPHMLNSVQRLAHLLTLYISPGVEGQDEWWQLLLLPVLFNSALVVMFPVWPSVHTYIYTSPFLWIWYLWNVLREFPHVSHNHLFGLQIELITFWRSLVKLSLHLFFLIPHGQIINFSTSFEPDKFPFFWREQPSSCLHVEPSERDPHNTEHNGASKRSRVGKKALQKLLSE